MRGLSLRPRKVSYGESKLQSSCKAWFDAEYPDLSLLLFAVANGGKRSKSEAVRLKAEGVVPGVADMILFLPRGGHNALCIEFKYGKNTQSERQKAWQAAVESKSKAKYVVVRDKEYFIKIIKQYLECG
jgi:hypothetical protein